MMYRSPSVPSFNEGFDEKTWEIHGGNMDTTWEKTWVKTWENR